jgi:hypothetical protein
MNLHYKIVEVWPSDHLIVARYWTDVLSEEFLTSDSNRKEDGTPVRCRSDVSLTLPIPAPTGKDLEDFIVRQAPIEWLETLEKVQAPEIDTSMKDVQFLVGVVNTKTSNEVKTIKEGGSFSQALTDEEIQKMIAKISMDNESK